MHIQRRTRLDARRHKPDYAIPLLTGVLVLLGLVVIYSISPALSNLQGGEVGQDYYVYDRHRKPGRWQGARSSRRSRRYDRSRRDAAGDRGRGRCAG